MSAGAFLTEVSWVTEDSGAALFSFNGWGLTMVDSLDTMFLLGLQDEFKHAVSQVTTLNFSMRDVCH